MSRYYDLDGKSIGMEEWAQLFEVKRAARSKGDNGDTSPGDDPTRIGSDHVGDKWVSTVWLGLDHSFTGGPPLIFETMVFPEDSMSEEGCWRYSTKEEALAGHQRVVAELLHTDPGVNGNADEAARVSPLPSAHPEVRQPERGGQ